VLHTEFCEVVGIIAVGNIKYCCAACSDCVADLIGIAPCDPFGYRRLIPCEGDVHFIYACLQVCGR